MKLKEQPQYQSFHLEGVEHIAPKDAYRYLSEGEVIMIDVREKDEFEVEHVNTPNVLLYPMPQIMERLQYIPDDRLVIVICAKGERSTKVARLLKIQGFAQVANLDGGMKQWLKDNLPVENIMPEACGSCHGEGCC
ncbi:MAG: rhodanese-like domain-containing protein [Bacteroidales bacterium]|nr:rhodanese-like domain-containing protein [Bacteroidales bacterium]MCF8333376.1 rhodanese-like domain-containing protein [Bacteroidales bacterium]